MPTALETAPSQEKILLTLIQDEAGELWASNPNRTGWTTNHTYGICYWDFIICDSKTRQDVKRILIEGQNLIGTLPTELGMLHELIELSLPNNGIFGSIPTEIINLPSLEVVNLGGNIVTGNVPQFSSSSIIRINMTRNNLNGTVDHDIGLWNPNLKTYDVSHNAVTGPIPPTFNRCKKLDTLDLSDNEITGTIPYTLGSCTKMKYLYLSDNNIMGSIPPQIAMPNAILEELWLYENYMSGTIPASLADLPKLFDFYIDGNKFTGTVPNELCNETINAEFFGNAEEKEKAFDFCESIACPPGYVSLEGTYPCAPCPDGTFSPYLGHKDNCYSTDPSKIMEELKVATDGNSWVTKWGKTSNYCTLSGVICNANKEITAIDLKGNGLKGSLPSSIGFLRFLDSLDVSDNELTGFIPSDLMWPPLSSLDLSGNKLKGIVPPELCFEQGINANGEGGKYSCRNIACPTGEYSSTGRGHPLGPAINERDAKEEVVQCKPCITAQFLGSKVCDLSNVKLTQEVTTAAGASIESDAYSDISKEAIFSIFLIIFFTLSGCVYLSYTRLRDYKLKRRIRNNTSTEAHEDGEWHVDDYDSEMKILRNQTGSNTTDAEISMDDEELELEDEAASERAGIL